MSDSNNEARFECFSSPVLRCICSHFLLRPLERGIHGRPACASFDDSSGTESIFSVGVASPSDEDRGVRSSDVAVVERDDSESRADGIVDALGEPIEDGEGDLDRR